VECSRPDRSQIETGRTGQDGAQDGQDRLEATVRTTFVVTSGEWLPLRIIPT
jgi:hypothetical protein